MLHPSPTKFKIKLKDQKKTVLASLLELAFLPAYCLTKAILQ